jgi:ubiquinone/menaquinone biosynthesis C-methylase UbiE
MCRMLTESKARSKALASAQIRDGETVLEVAIGTGLTFQEIVKANPNGYSVGVDLTPAMLQRAGARVAKIGGSRYQITVGDAYNLQFPDHHFDVLINSEGGSCAGHHS